MNRRATIIQSTPTRFIQQQRRYIHASIKASVGVDKVAENKIAEWLHNRGDESISAQKGKKLPSDRHKDLSRTLGVHHDYVHSKILADNNIKPESVERRLALDAAWKKLKEEIHAEYHDMDSNTQTSVNDFVALQSTRDRFEEEMKRLDQMAKSEEGE